MADKLSQPILTREGGAKPPAQSRRAMLASFTSGYSTALVVVALFLFYSLTSARFFGVDNAQNILDQMATVGVLGIGMTIVVLIGGIDLSVGSVTLLTGGISGTLVGAQLPVWLAIIAGVAAAMIVGLINGLLVVKFGINPVIVTLGTLIAVRGVGQAILWINNSWVWVTDPFFVYIASARWLFIPLSSVIMLGLYLIAALLLKQTRFGREVYAIGGNQWAAYLCGLPIARVKITAFVLCSCFAGIAGLLTAAHTGVVNPSFGSGLEFDTITAVVLGGASLRGGVGRVERTLLGAAILAMTLNYLTLRGVEDVWQTTVSGFLVLAAIVLDRLARRAQEG